MKKRQEDELRISQWRVEEGGNDAKGKWKGRRNAATNQFHPWGLFVLACQFILEEVAPQKTTQPIAHVKPFEPKPGNLCN